MPTVKENKNSLGDEVGAATKKKIRIAGMIYFEQQNSSETVANDVIRNVTLLM